MVSSFVHLEYIHVMSKQLEKQLSDGTVEIEPVLKTVNYLVSIDILTVSVLSHGSFDAQSRSMEERQRDCEEISQFIESNKSRSVIVFSDGSVYKGPVGGSACAAVLYPLSVNESYSTESKTVGDKVTALKCEIEGTALGLEVAKQYYLQHSTLLSICTFCVTAQRLLFQFPSPISMR